MKCYLVAGEISGDRLGAGLMEALRQHFPDIEFRGLGGERMQAAGLTSLYPLETLSVMGLVEVLRHLPTLLRVRRHLYRDALAWKADVMIGIDAPDFNLGLERRLRQQGVKTVHYVSPSVWAWRQGRIKGIARSVDLMLTFLPFEADFYRQHQVPVVHVGHPLADTLPMVPDPAAARQQLGLAGDGPVLALLPGSRSGEVKRLLPDFLGAARLLQARYPDLHCVLPAATADLKAFIEYELANWPDLSVQVTDGQADTVMTAASVVLLASGTATLEAMLLKKPMVVAYRVAPLTYAIVRRLMQAPHVALPNIIAGETLVPELLQDAATPFALAEAVAHWLDNAQDTSRLVGTFARFHQTLCCDASAKAAAAVADLVSPS